MAGGMFGLLFGAMLGAGGCTVSYFTDAGISPNSEIQRAVPLGAYVLWGAASWGSSVASAGPASG